MASSKYIDQMLLKVVKFLSPMLPLANCAMVDFITLNHWNSLLSPDLQKALMTLSDEQLRLLPSAHISLHQPTMDVNSLLELNSKCDNLKTFLMDVKCHQLESLGVLSDIDKILELHGKPSEPLIEMKNIMSEKKHHEVEVMSRVIATLSNGKETDWIIDMGSGLGYLGTSLSLLHQLNVLAVDARLSTTGNALMRTKRLERYYTSLWNRKRGKYTPGKSNQQKLLSKKSSVENPPNLESNGIIIALSDDLNKAYVRKSEDKDAIHQVHAINEQAPSGKYYGIMKFVEGNEDLLVLLKESALPCNSLLQHDDSTNSTSDNKITNQDISDSLISKSSIENDLSRLILNETGLNEDKNIINQSKELETETQRTGDSRPCIKHDSSIGLVGLHTCGNLASTCLQLYSSNPSVKFLLNIGCCYHFLGEQFKPLSEGADCIAAANQADNESTEKSKTAQTKPLHPGINGLIGFPMSDYLKDQKFYLGRNARMLSMQASDRLITADDNSINLLFWRALLQKLIIDKIGTPPISRVGSLKKCKNFPEYAKKALKILDISLNVTDDQLQEYEVEYHSQLDELKRFFLFRASLAPIIEGLILLDRLAFLCQRGGDNYLVKLFDPVTSPRCYGIISIR